MDGFKGVFGSTDSVLSTNKKFVDSKLGVFQFKTVGSSVKEWPRLEDMNLLDPMLEKLQTAWRGKVIVTQCSVVTGF